MEESLLEHEALLAAIQSAAEITATSITPFYGDASLEVTKKPSGEYVCVADRAAEAALVDALLPLIEGAGILSEESNERSGDGIWRWIIDPLDGTVNFIQGLPWFCISIALEHVPSQRIMGAAVYAPELKQHFTAWHGKGAWLNGQKLHNNRELRAPLVSVNPRVVKRLDVPDTVRDIIERYPNRYFGACALDLCQVASGRLSLAIMHDVRLWDVAAGHAIVKEAGGSVTYHNATCITSYS